MHIVTSACCRFVWQMMPDAGATVAVVFIMRQRQYRLSVCPSVCLICDIEVYDFHTGWNTSNIISRPNSLRSLLTLSPTWAIWSNGNTRHPKIRVK